MCDVPGHPSGDVNHNLLCGIDRKVDELSHNQAMLMSEVFGHDNKDGLLKKVDDIREGRVTAVRKESSAVSAGVAMLVAAFVAILQMFGIVPTGAQS